MDSSVQFTSVYINVMLVLDTYRPRNKITSLRTVLPTEKMRLQ